LETRRIELGDVALSFNEVAGEGRALVMLHGLTGHRGDFRPPPAAGPRRALTERPLSDAAKTPLEVPMLEERELRERFGAKYDAYCRRVPRFLPRLRL